MIRFQTIWSRYHLFWRNSLGIFWRWFESEGFAIFLIDKILSKINKCSPVIQTATIPTCNIRIIAKINPTHKSISSLIIKVTLSQPLILTSTNHIKWWQLDQVIWINTLPPINPAISSPSLLSSHQLSMSKRTLIPIHSFSLNVEILLITTTVNSI